MQGLLGGLVAMVSVSEKPLGLSQSGPSLTGVCLGVVPLECSRLLQLSSHPYQTCLLTF